MDFWTSGFRGGLEKGLRGISTGPVDHGARPGGPRWSTFLLLSFENRKLKRLEAFNWVGSRFPGVPPANDLAAPGDFYSSISVARSVGKLGDGPVRKCQTASSAQRHNHKLNPSPWYALAKLLVQRITEWLEPCPNCHFAEIYICNPQIGGAIAFQVRWLSPGCLGVLNQGSDRRPITHESRVEVAGASHHVWERVKKCRWVPVHWVSIVPFCASEPI
jgi:hypothetical protein